MRALVLAHRYVPRHCAGAETMLHAMVTALARRGHEVTVTLSAQAGDPYDIDGVQVYPTRTKRDVFDHLHGADVLITHLMNTPRAGLLGAWNDCPVVAIHHNGFNITRNAIVMPGARTDLVVVNSEWMAADLAAWFQARGIPERQPRTIIVRPTVNPVDYATTPGDCVTLVNLRRMEGGEQPHEQMGKGSETFWASAERMPRTRFLGVTGAYGGQDIRELPNVEVLSHVAAEHMRDKVYARTRILLMPSSYESWGRAGTEALCSGIPVIAHPTVGLLESLGDAGTFVDRDDIDGWVAAIRALSKPKSYVRASARALARAAELEAHRGADEALWVESVEQVAAIRRRPR